MNKTILITGTTSGIGLEMARALAMMGHSIIMGCRNLVKGEAVREQLIRESGHRRIHLYGLDLASLQSVREFADAVTADFDQLDVLINNAGLFADTPAKTRDGLELALGVNYIGPFYLTRLLLPAIKRSAQGRIINISSEAALFGKIRLAPHWAQQHPSGFRSYAASKLAQLLFTRQLARELADTRVTVNAVHPGRIASGIWQGQSLLMKIIGPINMKRYKSPVEGARTGVWLATAEDLATTSGGFFEKSGQPMKLNRRCQGQALQQALYLETIRLIEQLTERLTGAQTRPDSEQKDQAAETT